MSAIFNLPPHYEIAFNPNWREIMAQQKKHRLAGLYQVEMVNGDRLRLSETGSQNYAFKQKTSRTQKTQPSDIPTAIRWVSPRAFDLVTWIDELDKIRLGSLPDPQSPVARNHAFAANRLKDIILINGLLGTNYTGAQGNTATVLPAAQQLAVNLGGGANTGLTLGKLIAAAGKLNTSDIEDDGRVFVHAAKQLENLLTNVDQVNNTLYSDVKALMEGKIKRFMGADWIRTQLLPVASGIRSCIFYHKECVTLGLGQDMNSHIDVLPQNSHAIQVRSVVLLDATRTEEEGTVEIACDENV